MTTRVVREGESISAVVDLSQPGDVILVEPGTYNEKVKVEVAGLTLAAAAEEKPVLDGGYQYGDPLSWAGQVSLWADSIAVSNLEVARSAGLGVVAYGADCVVDGLDVHHSARNGIQVSGDRGLVQNCVAWWNCAHNQFGQAEGWGAGITACRYPTGVILRGNQSFNNWGEGISSFEAEGTRLEGNIVYDSYSVQLYVDNSPNTTVWGNLVYDTGDPDFGLRMASTMSICDEIYGEAPARSHHVTFANNLVVGGKRAFSFSSGYGHPDGGLKECLIAYNTFANSAQEPTVNISAGQHYNSFFRNNIILEQGPYDICSIVDNPELHFDHNLWSKQPPLWVTGQGDFVGDPLLAGGAIAPGGLGFGWFMPASTSPARGLALPINEITTDFLDKLRTRGTVGALETTMITGISTKKHTDPAVAIQIDGVWLATINHLDLSSFNTPELALAELERQAAVVLKDVYLHYNRDGTVAIAVGQEPRVWPEDEEEEGLTNG